MEEYGRVSIRRDVENVDRYSRICQYWEIYKLLFILHNIKPFWIEVDFTNEEVFLINSHQ